MEKKLTAHQEWSKFSNEIQADVNSVLGSFATEIATANIILSEKYETDPEEAGDFAAELVEYLDDNWGYMNDLFMVVGEWYEPTLVMSEEGVLSRHAKTEAFTPALSNGFMCKPVEQADGSEAPRIGLSFKFGPVPVILPSMQGSINPLAFAEPDKVSLQYMRPGDLSVVSSSLEEVGDTLQRVDSLLYLHTNHVGSSFYRQSAKKQETFMRSIVDSVADVMPAPETNDSLLLHDAKTQVIMVKDSSSDVLSYLRPASKSLRISGRILGVTLPDLVQDGFGKKYASPDEFKSADEGLGMVIEPHDLNFSLDQFDDPTCILPIRAVKKLKLTLE